MLWFLSFLWLICHRKKKRNCIYFLNATFHTVLINMWLKSVRDFFSFLPLLLLLPLLILIFIPVFVGQLFRIFYLIYISIIIINKMYADVDSEFSDIWLLFIHSFFLAFWFIVVYVERVRHIVFSFTIYTLLK